MTQGPPTFNSLHEKKCNLFLVWGLLLHSRMLLIIYRLSPILFPPSANSSGTRRTFCVFFVCRLMVTAAWWRRRKLRNELINVTYKWLESETRWLGPHDSQHVKHYVRPNRDPGQLQLSHRSLYSNDKCNIIIMASPWFNAPHAVVKTKVKRQKTHN